MIVEILSPSTAEKDFNEKYLLYERYGVKEYWIADPANKGIHLYKRNDENRFELEKIFELSERITSCVFKGLAINLTDIFDK